MNHRTLAEDQRYRDVEAAERERKREQEKKIAANLVKVREKREADIEAAIARKRRERIIGKPNRFTMTPACERTSARDRWTAAVALQIDRGVARPRAVRLADRDNPGLRERMLAEVNGIR